MAALFWEKSTAGWWLISQANRVKPIAGSRNLSTTYCLDAPSLQRSGALPAGRPPHTSPAGPPPHTSPASEIFGPCRSSRRLPRLRFTPPSLLLCCGTFGRSGTPGSFDHLASLRLLSSTTRCMLDLQLCLHRLAPRDHWDALQKWLSLFFM
jgi:hypothetical protein